MVDVTAKPRHGAPSFRERVVKMSPGALRAANGNPNREPLEIARIAGISAAKRTAELIPLCPLFVSHIDVQRGFCKDGVVLLPRLARRGATGVEMEALTAVQSLRSRL